MGGCSEGFLHEPIWQGIILGRALRDGCREPSHSASVCLGPAGFHPRACALPLPGLAETRSSPPVNLSVIGTGLLPGSDTLYSVNQLICGWLGTPLPHASSYESLASDLSYRHLLDL